MIGITMPDTIQSNELQAVSNRAMAVSAQLKSILLMVEDGFLTMCDLLLEAQEKNYSSIYGYATFSEWVERGSGLNISARTAYYYVNIASKTRELGLDREALKKIGISKLKEVLSLDTKDHADDIKGLLASADTDTIDVLKGKVSKIKAKDGQEPSVFITLRLDESVKAIVDRAVKLARLNYGDQVDEHGEVMDASHSKCMELICLAYTQDIDNYPQGVTEEQL